MCGLDPSGEDLPIGIILRSELPAARMKLGAPGGVGEWLNEQETLQRIARRHQARNGLKILARLSVGPSSSAWIERRQTKRVISINVANDAARMTRPLFEEDRLDGGLVNLVIERLRASGCQADQNQCREARNNHLFSVSATRR